MRHRPKTRSQYINDGDDAEIDPRRGGIANDEDQDKGNPPVAAVTDEWGGDDDGSGRPAYWWLR